MGKWCDGAPMTPRQPLAESGIFTVQGARSAIRNPPKARRCCNPPQSISRHACNATSPEAFEPGTSRARERTHNWSPKLPRGALCPVFRADSKSARESRPRGRDIANSQTPIRNPPIRSPRSPWLLARDRPMRSPFLLAEVPLASRSRCGSQPPGLDSIGCSAHRHVVNAWWR
eukprot:1988999-Alexandrium_andersonii.AAC.1